jgi:hypothetical protein
VPVPLESQPCRSEDRRYKGKGWPDHPKTAFCCNLVAAVATPFFVISTPASRLITHRSSLVTFTHPRTPTL